MSALLAAAPGAIGMISQWFGRKRRRGQEDAATKQMQELATLFGDQIDTAEESSQRSYLDNPDIQDALKQLEEMGMLQNRQIENQAATMGSTDESRIAAMGKVKEAQASGVSKLMSGANQYRNMLFGQKSNAMRGLAGVTGAQYQAGQQNRQNFNNSMQNILGPLQSSINAGFESGAFKFGK